MKYTRSHKKITPFGGVVPVLNKIKGLRIPQLIRRSLPSRPKQCKYSYDDVIVSHMIMTLCGGSRLQHVNKLKRSLEMIPGLFFPDHTTVGRVMKSLATEKQTTEHDSRVIDKMKRQSKTKTVKTKSIRQINENDTLNRMLVSITKAIGLLKKGKKYTLDMDATFIPCNSSDATKSFVQKKGFYPMVSCVDKLPVYIGMRNGNVSPSTEIKECLERTLNFLTEQDITIDKVRMDSAGYSNTSLDFMHNQGVKFYVAGAEKQNVMQNLKKQTEWAPFTLMTATVKWECESASIPHRLHDGEHEYRLVVLRVKLDGKKKPQGWTKGVEYSYKIVITNDLESSELDVIKFYNQRATSEKNFDTLKNDFNWANVPFIKMEFNTVFLILAALTNNVYQALLKKVHKHVDGLELKSRLKDFIFLFMSVACSIEGDECIFYSTDVCYEKIC